MLAEARGGEEAKKIAEERGSSGRSSGSGGDMHGSGRIALLRLGILTHIHVCAHRHTSAAVRWATSVRVRRRRGVKFSAAGALLVKVPRLAAVVPP